MDTSNHNMQSLFVQLGLPSEERDIQRFIVSHVISPSKPLAEANFWRPSQAQFLREALQDDADWAELVDQLAAQLRR